MQNSPRISEAEWQVMEILWARHPLTAAEVIDALAESTKWSGNTVRTLLTRLERKGVLHIDKDGARLTYRPKVDRDCLVAAESTSFLDRVFGGMTKPLLLHFAQQSELTPDDIRELKRILGKGDKKS
jgi:BlaI family penicillinase repressor